MAEIFRQGISIGDDNNTASYNVPIQGETTAGTINWRRESILCPRRASNLKKFDSFRNYLHDVILCMSLIRFFFVMFPEEYLEQVLIPGTNKGLIVPMDIQYFIKWVGFWIYMACWVVIESRRCWWSTTTSSMAKGAPFRINCIMSCNRFDSIISYFRFTNREVL